MGCADIYLSLFAGIFTSTEILSVTLDILLLTISLSLTLNCDLNELEIIVIKVSFTSPEVTLGKSPIDIICSLESFAVDNLFLNFAAIAAAKINSAISPLLYSVATYFLFFIIYF